jgi:uncharacterized damage-inducible protein DinB
MIGVAYVRQMARYNRWQNESLFAVADRLPDEERRRERGAFFGSIHGTLNHLLWADAMWLSRFAGTPRPAAAGIADSVRLHENWDELKRERAVCDAAIMAWAEALDPGWLEGDLTWYSGSAKRDVTRPKALLATHLFNHATHHRGQVHCMLTQAGAKAHVSDLAFMPD